MSVLEELCYPKSFPQQMKNLSSQKPKIKLSSSDLLFKILGINNFEEADGSYLEFKPMNLKYCVSTKIHVFFLQRRSYFHVKKKKKKLH